MINLYDWLDNTTFFVGLTIWTSKAHYLEHLGPKNTAKRQWFRVPDFTKSPPHLGPISCSPISCSRFDVYLLVISISIRKSVWGKFSSPFTTSIYYWKHHQLALNFCNNGSTDFVKNEVEKHCSFHYFLRCFGGTFLAHICDSRFDVYLLVISVGIRKSVWCRSLTRTG